MRVTVRVCKQATASSSALGIVLCLCLVAVPGTGQDQALDAAAVLTRAREAAGGVAWDAVTATHVTAAMATGGLEGTAETWDDLLGGRTYNRFQLGPARGAEGYDGEVAWQQDASGQVRQLQGEEELLVMVNGAYRRCLAYWYPERWPATIEYLGTQRQADHELYGISLLPEGGRRFELWIDGETWLIDRSVEERAHETITVFFSDYREVDGLQVAFARRRSNGTEQYDQHIRITAFELNPSLDDVDFGEPPPPPPDYVFLPEGGEESDAGATRTTSVPFELLNHHLYLEVMLNGRGPFTMLCDTGGANIITPWVAEQLGVEPEGTLEVRGAGEETRDISLVTLESLQVGRMRLDNQLFIVLALDDLEKVEDVRMAGLIGYEVFKRFVVRIDYSSGRLSLSDPAAFVYTGKGVRVPFRFNERIPQVDGAINGVPGTFDIDTGSRATVDLFAPFVARHELALQAGTGVEAITGWGVGGPTRSRVTRAESLRLGSVEIADPVVELSLQEKGAFADPHGAGNVGNGVLKRFDIVFDYGNQVMILEPNAAFKERDAFDRSGMWLNRGSDGPHDGFEVIDVTAGGAAAEAGIIVGERISAVDGKDAAEVSLPALRERVRSEPPESEVRLTVVAADGTSRQVVLKLRDLV